MLYGNLGAAYQALGRYDEAKATIKQAQARGLDQSKMHFAAYEIAFAEGDQAEMQRQLEWAPGSRAEGVFFYLQAHAAAFSDSAKISRNFFAARRSTQ
jgi:tetratricopeptide (TPR) repeat protein